MSARPSRRSLLAAGLAALGLSVVIGGWLITGWRSTRAEAEAVRRAPAERARRVASDLASRLAARLEQLAAREDQRPFFHYGNLYHDPRGASTGQSVTPSPLVAGNSDPLVETNYQIDARGKLTVPTINDEVPELSNPARLTRDRRVLATLRSAIAQLGSTDLGKAPVRVAVLDNRRPQARAQLARVTPDVYAQNARSNQIYQQLQQQAPPPAPNRRAAAGTKHKGQVEIVTRPFSWRTGTLRDHPTLIGLREVATPDGTLVQGFVVDRQAVARWLTERAPESLRPRFGSARDQASAPVPSLGSNWHVSVDTTNAIAAADRKATRLERRFWWRLIPASAVAMLCFGLMVWIVARTEQLARQRSQFAAAAAHELRTPLAGLQLYGDMLADDLGDRTRKTEYARRISEEAARLGRVVGNVLGFTQLERGTLSVDPRPGDAALTVRRVVDRFGPVLEHAGMRVNVEAPETAPALFDEDAVGRILQNLMDNAEKHTRGHEPRTLTLAITRTAPVVISVRDDGPGVPARLARALFQPFERGVDADGPAGLGLGLAMALALARAQGGDLRYRPTTPGACFELTLPAR